MRRWGSGPTGGQWIGSSVSNLQLGTDMEICRGIRRPVLARFEPTCCRVGRLRREAADVMNVGHGARQQKVIACRQVVVV